MVSFSGSGSSCGLEARPIDLEANAARPASSRASVLTNYRADVAGTDDLDNDVAGRFEALNRTADIEGCEHPIVALVRLRALLEVSRVCVKLVSTFAKDLCNKQAICWQTCLFCSPLAGDTRLVAEKALLSALDTVARCTQKSSQRLTRFWRKWQAVR